MDAMTGYEPEMKIIMETIRCVEVETSRNPDKIFYSCVFDCKIFDSRPIRHHKTSSDSIFVGSTLKYAEGGQEINPRK